MTIPSKTRRCLPLMFSIGALVSILLPAFVGAAPAPLTLDLFSSVSTATPGQQVSITATLKASGLTHERVRLTISLSAAGSVRDIASAAGECAITTPTTAQCTLSVRNVGASATVQAIMRSQTSAPALVANATAISDGDNTVVQAEPVTIAIVGDPVATETERPTSTVTRSATATHTPSSTERATETNEATATPPLGQRPDACEPNDEPQKACVLQLDAVNGPYTLLPETDRDEYSVDLGSAPPSPTVVWVRAVEGLDLVTTIRHADTDALIATLASPAISTTIPVDVVGWVRLRVEQRSPAAVASPIYRIELRQHDVLPAPPLATPPSGRVPPDALENNWNPQTATPIAVGYAYDLNFTCPVIWGCPGGDFDYLRVPVKAGIPYLLATFDLGPGVDTVLDLFWGSETVPVASNDDAHPGYSGLSLLRWTAPSDGEIVVRIGPRTGGTLAVVPDKQAGTYRFAVAMADSPFGRDLLERVQGQADIETSTATPTMPPPVAQPRVPSRPPEPAPSAPSPVEAPRTTASTPVVTPTTAVVPNVPKGVAMTVTTATLQLQPDAGSAPLATLPPDTLVTLLGESSGLWVRVAAPNVVLPGWLRSTDLQRVSASVPQPPAPPTSSAATAAAGGGGSASGNGTSTGPTPTATGAASITLLDPVPPPQPPAPPQRVSHTVRVIVVEAGTLPPTPLPGALAPTASAVPRGVAGLRVLLVSALGDVLAEGITPASGQLTLVRDSDPSAALFVTLPQAGLTIPVPREASPPSNGSSDTFTLTIALPGGGLP